MAMGKKGEQQDELFVPYSQMRSAGHPFYRALDGVLREHGFDGYAEKVCARFYHPVMGRPGLAPGNYFRSLLVGYFEGIDSERGIAWRLADSLSLRDFLGLPTDKAPPDHSTISRTRRLIDEETHEEIFAWVLGLLSKERSFAHALETGGMRRTHLRFHYNITKRMLIHVAGFNLGLLMRKRFGVGTPRGLQGRLAAAIAACVVLIDVISDLLRVPRRAPHPEPRADINSCCLTPNLAAA